MLDSKYASYVVRKLGSDERIISFNCGDDDLNDFICNESHLYRDEMLSVSYVMESADDFSHEGVVAYFSLANDKVSVGDFENKTEFNRFRRRFKNEKRIKGYPAVKICRLGVSVDAKGCGIGSSLLNFIKSYFVEDNKTGCRFLTVDAYAAAVSFYEANGFVPLNDDDKDAATRLLYYDLKSSV